MTDQVSSKSDELALLESFKNELMLICERFSLKLLGDGDYGISIRTADGKTELTDCIWEISEEGIQQW